MHIESNTPALRLGLGLDYIQQRVMVRLTVTVRVTTDRGLGLWLTVDRGLRLSTAARGRSGYLEGCPSLTTHVPLAVVLVRYCHTSTDSLSAPSN